MASLKKKDIDRPSVRNEDLGRTSWHGCGRLTSHARSRSGGFQPQRAHARIARRLASTPPGRSRPRSTFLPTRRSAGSAQPSDGQANAGEGTVSLCALWSDECVSVDSHRRRGTRTAGPRLSFGSTSPSRGRQGWPRSRSRRRTRSRTGLGSGVTAGTAGGRRW